MAKKNGRLRGRIVETYGTIGAFAEQLGQSRVNISAKLSGKTAFTANDIRRWSDKLKIRPEDIGKFFFEA